MVPTMRERTPYNGVAPVGFQVLPVIRSRTPTVWKSGMESLTRKNMMKNTLRTANDAVANQRLRMNFSFQPCI